MIPISAFVIIVSALFLAGVYIGFRLGKVSQPDVITNISLSLPADSNQVIELTPLDPSIIGSGSRAQLWWTVYNRTYTYDSIDEAIEAANDAVETAFGPIK